MIFDFILVGQGLAGSILGWEILKRGHTVLIIDNGHKWSSSRVAAGIVNPVSGKRLAISKDIEEQLVVARAFYNEVEEVFGRKFFFPRTIRRFIDDCKLIDSRYADAAFQSFLGERKEKYFEIIGGGYLETKDFLSYMTAYFNQYAKVIAEDFFYDDFDAERISYREFSGKNLVFCEGYRVINNPWFKNELWAPARGEILNVNFPDGDRSTIINNGKWLLPLEYGGYRAGATYSWDDLSEGTTELGKEEIMKTLKEVVGDKLNCVGQECGIRPSTKNSMPIIKRHKHFKHCFCFNGFGSKGVLTIPSYVKRFFEL